MTSSELSEARPADSGTRSVPGPVRVAAVASLGAGAVHAAAAGAHSEPRATAVAFAVVAVVQLGWGGLALVRSGLRVGVAGLVVHAVALAGWVAVKTTGIGFVAGLDVPESPAFPDSLAAALAVVAALGAASALAGEARWVARPRPALVGLVSVACLGLGVPVMLATGSHGRGGGETATTGGDEHAHGDDETGEHDDGEDAHGGGAHGEASTPPEPYTATLPVNLGGVDGVTPEQQAEAEALVTETLQVLPARFSDWTTLESRGWYSIGDGITGHEHFINWPLLEDGKMFDPEAPESLVFEIAPDGSKKLVAAMYMASRSVTLETVPTFGGDLVQWHIHDNLCYRGEQFKWRIASVADPPEECPLGTFRLKPHPPMIHVWIVPHECGPFASLEGTGGGTIPEGEERLCDHAHGAPTDAAESAGATESAGAAESAADSP